MTVALSGGSTGEALEILRPGEQLIIEVTLLLVGSMLQHAPSSRLACDSNGFALLGPNLQTLPSPLWRKFWGNLQKNVQHEESCLVPACPGRAG